MSIVTRTAAKAYFNTGDTPTETEFANTIDSTLFNEDLDADSMMAADSDTKVATQKATKSALALKETAANKDASGGYAGLTLLKINFKNVLGTFISFFTNSNTAARTYTFQDRNGTISDDTDLALKATVASVNAKAGMCMCFASPNLSTVDGSTYYFGLCPLNGGTTATAINRVYVPITGTVKAIYLFFTQTAGSNENSTMYFRLNNTTDTVVTSTLDHSGATTIGSNASLSIAVTAGDYFEMKWLQPTWVTNPSSVRISFVVYID